MIAGWLFVRSYHFYEEWFDDFLLIMDFYQCVYYMVCINTLVMLLQKLVTILNSYTILFIWGNMSNSETYNIKNAEMKEILDTEKIILQNTLNDLKSDI